MERQNSDRAEQQRQDDQQTTQRNHDQQEVERIQHVIDVELQRLVQREQENLNERIENLNETRRQLERQNEDLAGIRQQFEIEQDILRRQDLREQVERIARGLYRGRLQRAMGVAGGISTSSNDGLTSGRIERFEHFRADETLVGEQCLVCMKDLEIGTLMVRLDCHVSHFLCKICANTWFKDNKTCPTCRHEFN